MFIIRYSYSSVLILIVWGSCSCLSLCSSWCCHCSYCWFCVWLSVVMLSAVVVVIVAIVDGGCVFTTLLLIVACAVIVVITVGFVCWYWCQS